MSSVGSSDSSNRQDEVIRRQREETEKTEAANAKKHKREIRRMTEQHYQEIEKLKEQHAQQLNSIKGRSQENFSARDHQYQQDINELREMHRKQIQSTSEESQRREETLRKATSGDMNQQKTVSNQRVESLTTDYQKGLQEHEATFQKNIKEAREAQAQALKATRERLTRAHEMEKKAIVEERNKSVGGLQKQYADHREASSSTIKGQELRHMQDKHRASENLLRTVANERMNQSDQAEMMRDGFQDGIETMRERFEKASQKERAAQNLSSNMLKSTAMDRIDNQVRRLENEKQDLKDANTRDRLLNNQSKNREVKNIANAWNKNVENYKHQRDEAVRSSNERNAKDVSDVRGEMGKQLTDTNRFYRGRMEEQGRIQRQAYDNLVGDFEGRQEYTKTMSETRVKNIADNALAEKARLSELQIETHHATQRQHQDDMKALRAFMEDDKQQTVNRMQDMMRKQEIQHSERMANIVSKYEKQIQGLKDMNMRDQRLSAENLKRTVDELQRTHKLSLDQVESKNREQLRQVNAQQSEEVRQLNKRHEERLDSVLVEVKKT